MEQETQERTQAGKTGGHNGEVGLGGGPEADAY